MVLIKRYKEPKNFSDYVSKYEQVEPDFNLNLWWWKNKNCIGEENTYEMEETSSDENPAVDDDAFKGDEKP